MAPGRSRGEQRQQQTIEDIRNDCQLVLANKNLDQDKLPAFPIQFFAK